MTRLSGAVVAGISAPITAVGGCDRTAKETSLAPLVDYRQYVTRYKERARPFSSLVFDNPETRPVCVGTWSTSWVTRSGGIGFICQAGRNGNDTGLQRRRPGVGMPEADAGGDRRIRNPQGDRGKIRHGAWLTSD